MLQVIDEQLLLLMERKTHLLSRVGLGSCVSLTDKLTKVNEQVLDLKAAAQWVMTRQAEIDDFLVPQGKTLVGCARGVHHEGHPLDGRG